MPSAVLIGIPLYSNATGVIPIVDALLGKGVPIGIVRALMMSVAAISLPEMIILRKVLKPQLIASVTGILFITFIGVGFYSTLYWHKGRRMEYDVATPALLLKIFSTKTKGLEHPIEREEK